MSGLLGKIDHFDPELEDWFQYIEQLGEFFEANRIVGEESKAKTQLTFLSVVWPSPYKLLQSILSPVKPSEKIFEEPLQPPLSEVMQHFRFNTRSQKPGESVATYVAELKRLAEFCNYGVSLDKIIQYRLVSGIIDHNIQKRLLSETVLMYTQALEIAQGVEEAEKNLREMRAPDKTMPWQDHKLSVSNTTYTTLLVRNGRGNNPVSTILAVIAVERLDTELQNANLETNHVIVVAGKATWSKCAHTQERYSKVHSDYKTRDIYNQFTR